MTTTTQKIPSGYKQTEIGIIPADWDVKKLGTYGKFKGGNGFPLKYQGREDGKYPFYKVSDMNNEGNQVFMKDSNNYINDDVKRILNIFVFPKNTIVFAKIGAAIYLERKKILSKESSIDNNMMGFILDEAQTDCRFFHYLFLNTQLGKLVSATALPSLNGKQIADLPFAFPKKDEQSTISSVLSDTDALIAKLEKLIEKKKNIKQGVMQELLTGKRRLAGFSDKWESRRLDDIFRVTRGQVLAMTKTTKYKIGDYRYPVYSSQTKENGLAGYYKDYLFENCITWTTDGANAGDVKYRPGKFYCTNVCGVLESNKGYANLCIASIFNSVSRNYVSYIGNPKLMNNVVADIVITIPSSVKEQVAISEVISDMDTEIEKLESQLTKYQNIKQGMMQTLLTGKIRLLTK
jgi:type I restriction enzyme S subunit